MKQVPKWFNCLTQLGCFFHIYQLQISERMSVRCIFDARLAFDNFQWISESLLNFFLWGVHVIFLRFGWKFHCILGTSYTFTDAGPVFKKCTSKFAKRVDFMVSTFTTPPPPQRQQQQWKKPTSKQRDIGDWGRWWLCLFPMEMVSRCLHASLDSSIDTHEMCVLLSLSITP